MNKLSEKAISYDSYTEMAEYYFKDVDHKPFNALYERPGTLSLMPSVKGKVVLDAGCAAGWYTKWLLDQGAEPIAIDFNEEMVKFTEIRVNSLCKVVQHDLNNPLDFIEDESLDIILSSLTLHYIKDWDSVFGEFYKKLKKGGCLVFSTHHPFMDFSHFNVDNYFDIRLLNDVWNTSKGKVSVSFYRRPLQEIIRPLLESGFQIEALTEPFPDKKFEEESPKTYKRLCEQPQFLFIGAKKM